MPPGEKERCDHRMPLAPFRDPVVAFAWQPGMRHGPPQPRHICDRIACHWGANDETACQFSLG